MLNDTGPAFFEQLRLAIRERPAFRDAAIAVLQDARNPDDPVLAGAPPEARMMIPLLVPGLIQMVGSMGGNENAG